MKIKNTSRTRNIGTFLIVGICSLCFAAILSGCSVPSKDAHVYFFQKEKLIPVSRELPTNENPVMIAIDQLLRGPNEQEVANGFTTKIQAGTRSRNVDVEGHTAIVDFNSSLVEFDGGTDEAKGIVAQIVYTATDVRGVKQVILKLQGSDQFIMGPGYVIDHPLTRDDVKI
jgi:spore germination protein GerM